MEESQEYLFKAITEMAAKLGVEVKMIQQCDTQILDRPSCPNVEGKNGDVISLKDKAALYLVYNPSLQKQRIPAVQIHDMQHSEDHSYMSQFDKSNPRNRDVKKWNAHLQTFEDVYSESYCFDMIDS